ncbi:MAG: ATP synthase F1 subunit delta [Acidimicrobiaceae bacterium]|nr:ATP synthase F1 subunit delta [Acidimicrobiaceae bacterium]
MREVIRGYAAAVFENLPEAEVGEVGAALRQFSEALSGNEDLARTLGDDALPLAVRSGIVADLLERAPRAARSLVLFAVRADQASELSNDVGWLVFRAGEELPRRAGEPDPDPSVGHSGVNERLNGYSLALFERVDDEAVIDEVEDQLFRVSRIIESNRALGDTLTNFDLPVDLREGVVTDLLTGKAEEVTIELVRYAVRENRGQLPSHLDWLAERVAEERGRRNAAVSSAVELRPEQREQLSESLARLTGRRVSLQTEVDPDLLGGLRVVVGDTVLDGTVRRRLEQVGRVLVHGTRQRPGGEERPS